jgi:DedD protein
MRSIEETEEQEHSDTEITLGMKSLLGVFFGLVLICGVFFGFGYSLGRGSSGLPKASSRATSEGAAVALPPKPPARPPLTSAASENDSSATAPYSPGPDPREGETPPATPRKPSAGVIKPVLQDSEVATSSAPSKSAPAAATPSTLTPAAAKAFPTVGSTSAAAAPASSGGPTMVQIAAVSRQEDADVLVAALKKRGYNVIVRNEPRDSLLHIQIGPFATRDEAKAMRAKLLADGYNAILK